MQATINYYRVDMVKVEEIDFQEHSREELFPDYYAVTSQYLYYWDSKKNKNTKKKYSDLLQLYLCHEDKIVHIGTIQQLEQLRKAQPEKLIEYMDNSFNLELAQERVDRIKEEKEKKRIENEEKERAWKEKEEQEKTAQLNSDNDKLRKVLSGEKIVLEKDEFIRLYEKTGKLALRTKGFILEKVLSVTVENRCIIGCSCIHGVKKVGSLFTLTF